MLQPMHSDVARQQQPGRSVVNSSFSTGVSLVPPNIASHHFARLERLHAAEPFGRSTRPLWLFRVVSLETIQRALLEPSNRSYA